MSWLRHLLTGKEKRKRNQIRIHEPEFTEEQREVMECGPEPESAPEPTKLKLYECNGCEVRANTKSEARAKLKRAFGLPRLPDGTKVICKG